MPQPIRVFIVDDSAVVRQILTRLVGSQTDMVVAETAVDPVIAWQKLEAAKADVMVLDLEMPRMDGLTFLGKLMESRPLPVIVFSSLSQPGSLKALDALRAGAVDVAAKPHGPFSVGEAGQQLLEKIRAAALARPTLRLSATRPLRENPPPAAAPAKPRGPNGEWAAWDGPLVLLGASTGGTEALREVMVRLPANFPPILVVQHIPAIFSRAFANRLNELCAISVKEAADGDPVRPGQALVAPGGFHLTVVRAGPRLQARVLTGPPVWHQRPAVDVLFKSAVGLPNRVIAALFTGMGKDGAEGLLALRQHGARTFGQSEETCVVYGMPKAAHDLGACERMVPLPRLADFLCQSVALSPLHA